MTGFKWHDARLFVLTTREACLHTHNPAILVPSAGAAHANAKGYFKSYTAPNLTYCSCPTSKSQFHKTLWNISGNNNPLCVKVKSGVILANISNRLKRFMIFACVPWNCVTFTSSVFFPLTRVEGDGQASANQIIQMVMMIWPYPQVLPTNRNTGIWGNRRQQ